MAFSLVLLKNGRWYAAPLRLNSWFLVPLLVLSVILVSLFLKRKGKLTFPKFIALFLFLVYLCFLLSVTLFPINLFGPHASVYKNGLGQENVMFNLDIDQLRLYSGRRILGNIVMLSPLAFFVALFWNKAQKLLSNILICFFISLAIEFVQLGMSYFYLGNRLWDITDIILNTSGSLLGFSIFIIFRWCFKNEMDSLKLL
ncbi:VanZ family protein [Lacticaseibacillus salsurivasis]|uniref:VanZ family protein n=1 Tax=Lacticaseibacillus salsurivasis TaxID=3081441 RepID=UPI00342F2A67